MVRTHTVNPQRIQPEDGREYEFTFGLFPNYNGDDEYLEASVWLVIDGEPVAKWYICESLNQAEDVARQLSEKYHIPYHIDDNTELV
jgi:hypothetical protein